jgi:hypothetical protein
LTICRETEIDELDFIEIILVLYEDVFKFQISVNQTLDMHVAHSAYNLSENGDGLRLVEAFSLAFFDKVIQIFAVAQLHNEVALGWRINHLEQFHDVGVVHAGKDVNLAMDRHQLALMRQFRLLVSFERHRVPSGAMHSSVNLRKSALSN